MSSSSDSTNGDFTIVEEREIGDAQSVLDDDESVKIINVESVADRQKEFREKFVKMEMELKVTKNLHMITKLELENMALQEKVKHQEMVEKLNALQAKVEKMEQEKRTRENPKNAPIDQIKQLKNDQKKLMDRIHALEKLNLRQTHLSVGPQSYRTTSRLVSNFQQNFWDADFCDGRLKIEGPNHLTVNYVEYELDFCSVFAKHPILMGIGSTDTFYFEMSLIKMERFADFGFAITKLAEEAIRRCRGTYAYSNSGAFYTNSAIKIKYANAYGAGDTVGCGVCLANRRIFFTKNGEFLKSFDLVLPSYDLPLFPFVTLWRYGDKIEANFGPKFEFNLATLKDQINNAI